MANVTNVHISKVTKPGYFCLLNGYYVMSMNRTITKLILRRCKCHTYIKYTNIELKMGGRTIYRTLSPKRTPFQTGIDRWPHL
jgi:hypothetical protein